MSDRMPGTRRDFVSVMGQQVRNVAKATQPSSALRVGDWVLEARPDGLSVTHAPTGRKTQLAQTPADFRDEDSAYHPSSDVIHEDDPRWNCQTMGNRVCGPGAPPPMSQAEYEALIAQGGF